MFNPNGTVVVNGITDEELVKILEIKIKHEQSLTFNPQQLQAQPGSAGQPQHPPFYNNAVFGWQREEGLAAVYEIITMLLKKDAKSATQGQ